MSDVDPVEYFQSRERAERAAAKRANLSAARRIQNVQNEPRQSAERAPGRLRPQPTPG
jgi:hypothetical protein